MKYHRITRVRGFTLIEILVVVAIIAILAAAGVGGMRFVYENARKANAMLVCKDVELAVENFYIQYGVLPSYGDAGNDELIATDTNADLLNILQALEDVESPINKNKLKHLSVKRGKNDKDGLIYNDAGDQILGLYDPWGGRYNIVLDMDGDQSVTVRRKGSSKVEVLDNTRVAIWTDGRDAAKGEVGDTKDDVTSW